MVININNGWSWKGIVAVKFLANNRFGNVLFENEDGTIWRIIPEEASCNKIADSTEGMKAVFADKDFEEDWKMSNLLAEAEQALGLLDEGQVYCLKIPAIVGGTYDVSNFGKISMTELMEASGSLAYQIKDLKEGDQVKIVIK